MDFPAQKKLHAAVTVNVISVLIMRQIQTNVKMIIRCNSLDVVLFNFLGITITEILVRVILEMKMFYSKTLHLWIMMKICVGLQLFGFG